MSRVQKWGQIGGRASKAQTTWKHSTYSDDKPYNYVVDRSSFIGELQAAK
jgi:hypothetical protein